jgi:hypothetical protein
VTRLPLHHRDAHADVRDPTGAELEQLDAGQERRQRIAQLVTERGQELVLAPVASRSSASCRRI